MHTSRLDGGNELEIGICAVVGREGLLLIEWIEYHLLIGIKNFYLYITDPRHSSIEEYNLTMSLLDPYLRSQRLNFQVFHQILSIPGMIASQPEAFFRCQRQFDGVTDWLFFIDVDEFIAFPKGKSLADVLNSILLRNQGSDVNAICLGWTELLPQNRFIDSSIHRGYDSLLTQVVHHSPLEHLQTITHGKIGVYHQKNKALTQDCHWSSTPRHLRHNCFGGNANITVIFPSGTQTTDELCLGYTQNDQQVLTLYHFFFRTCHEWVNELVPKRKSWLSEFGQNKFKWAEPRQDADYCEKVSSLYSIQGISPLNASYLLRFSEPLLKAVRMHPLWGTPVILPQSKEKHDSLETDVTQKIPSWQSKLGSFLGRSQKKGRYKNRNSLSRVLTALT